MTDALKVRGAMETEILRLSSSDSIRRAVAALIEAKVPAAAVVEADGILCGILTPKDCFRPALHASYYQEWRGTIAEHMSVDVLTIEADDDIVRAAEIFLDKPHRILPVLDGGKLVGMLDRAAVMAVLFRSG